MACGHMALNMVGYAAISQIGCQILDYNFHNYVERGLLETRFSCISPFSSAL
jgi:hypothetical protein